MSEQNKPWCSYCGPNHIDGAAHNDRTEDGCFYGDLPGERKPDEQNITPQEIAEGLRLADAASREYIELKRGKLIGDGLAEDRFENWANPERVTRLLKAAEELRHTRIALQNQRETSQDLLRQRDAFAERLEELPAKASESEAINAELLRAASKFLQAVSKYFEYDGPDEDCDEFRAAIARAGGQQ